MMLLRTLVLEHSGHDTPVNGALLCGFAVTQIGSNFLAYSLDEEIEPGSSRVYIASLRKKSERYFLGGIDSPSDLQVAMHVFKQILTVAAASGGKPGGTSEAHIPYHFVDLKGCRLPPARPEDHHSLTIKKVLVMKVITLGASVPGLPAIESSSLIVPSIRFSSQMVAPSNAVRHAPSPTPEPQAQPEPLLESMTEAIEPVQLALECDQTLPAPASEAQSSLLAMDSTLTNLARVAQELTQQKNIVLKQEEELGQSRSLLLQERANWEQAKQQEAGRAAENELDLQQLAQTLNTREAQLAGRLAAQQVEQHRLEELAHRLEGQAAQLHSHDLAVRHREDQLAAGMSQMFRLRDSLRGLFHDLDEMLGPEGEHGQGTGDEHMA
ncbi:hypothetical protein GIR22_09795 [Pseudomonas sp. CCM 7891]|uniref:Uncharacterized protein n=1 Tax=Pseudomonas karstica TaxID=1055468 RepID=A0A7X2RT19_9PSED|nr:hypothetical protein [Pseudomonas karstica]MTD19432.1 hypothetical protein [Pseudomonas karstica]